MKPVNNNFVHLILIFAGLVLLWFFSSLWLREPILVWLLLLAILSFIIIGRDFHNLKPKDWKIAIVLSVLVSFSNPVFAGLSLLAYLASCLLLKDKDSEQLLLLPNNLSKFLNDIGLGLLVGFVLGVFNIILAKASVSMPTSFSFQPIFNALRAGIFEETVFRLFFFALLVSIIKKDYFSKLENALIYLILIVPHTLLHFSVKQFDVGTVVVLSFLFGLPFALLLRKKGVLSAIIAHTMVDLIRFVFISF